jgi:hypothetical protein
LYNTRTANTPGLLLLLALLLPSLLALLPLLLLLLLVGLLLPMLLLGLIVGGVSSHSSNTRLLMYGGHRSMSAPKAAYHHNKHNTQHMTCVKCGWHHFTSLHGECWAEVPGSECVGVGVWGLGYQTQNPAWWTVPCCSCRSSTDDQP